jgi:hypothetical protein
MKLFALALSAVILIMSIASAAESSVSYHSISVDNLDIFYREAGPKGAPVILLLHGLPSSSRMYEPLLEAEGNHRTYPVIYGQPADS